MTTEAAPRDATKAPPTEDDYDDTVTPSGKPTGKTKADAEPTKPEPKYIAGRLNAAYTTGATNDDIKNEVGTIRERATRRDGRPTAVVAQFQRNLSRKVRASIIALAVKKFGRVPSAAAVDATERAWNERWLAKFTEAAQRELANHDHDAHAQDPAHEKALAQMHLGQIARGQEARTAERRVTGEDRRSGKKYKVQFNRRESGDDRRAGDRRGARTDASATKYDESETRDWHGRWTGEAGNAVGERVGSMGHVLHGRVHEDPVHRTADGRTLAVCRVSMTEIPAVHSIFGTSTEYQSAFAGLVTVAALTKARIRYKDSKLTDIVHDYLLRSYPPKVVEWVAGGDWEFSPRVALADINTAFRPGGRNPDKVDHMAEALDNGASMDPIVLVRRPTPNGYVYDIADGWHRALAAERAGWDSVPAFCGTGFEDPEDWGSRMQDESDSKKVAHAELAVLRRFVRKGGKVANFRTDVVDSDIMRRVADFLEDGQTPLEAALAWAHSRVDKDGGNPQGLRDWYNGGADGQIDWGSDGDFMDCVGVAGQHMDEDDAKGFCNLRHQDATSGAPGTEKSIGVSAGLVPYDLAGSRPSPAACPICGKALIDGACPDDKVVKFDPSEARDQLGRWMQSGGGDPTEAGREADTKAGHHVGAPRYGSVADFGGHPRWSSTCPTCGKEVWYNRVAAQYHHVTKGMVLKYDPEQPRDDDGKWSGGAGTSSRVDDEAHRAVDAVVAGERPTVGRKDVKDFLAACIGRNDAPDLTELRVKGTLKFGGDGLGIARADMPQIPKELRGDFRDTLEAKGVSFKKDEVRPEDLKPIQKEIDATHVAEVLAEMREVGPDSRRIMITKDDYVLDGHHWWGAATALSFEAPNVRLPVWRIGLDHDDAMKAALDWNKEAGIVGKPMGSKVEKYQDGEPLSLLDAIDAELARRGVDLSKLA